MSQMTACASVSGVLAISTFYLNSAMAVNGVRCITVLISRRKCPGNSTKPWLLSASKTSASRRLKIPTLYQGNSSSAIDWDETLCEYTCALIQLPASFRGKQYSFCSHLMAIAKRMVVNPLPVVLLSDTEVKDAKWQPLHEQLHRCFKTLGCTPLRFLQLWDASCLPLFLAG